MFLTGSQLDYILQMKSAILSAHDNLEKIEAKVENYDPENESAWFNAERLERWYFAAVHRYVQLCKDFKKWLYSLDYWETPAALRYTETTNPLYKAVLVNP